MVLLRLDKYIANVLAEAEIAGAPIVEFELFPIFKKINGEERICISIGGVVEVPRHKIKFSIETSKSK